MDLDARIGRAKAIIAVLKQDKNSTVRAQAAKQLETILRGAIRQRDLGRPNSAAKLLDWAATP